MGVSVHDIGNTKKENDLKEIMMENINTSNKRHEAIAWGIGFVLIGILSLMPGNQNGMGFLGIGLILLGLNLARSLKHVPTNGFTTALGILASILGIVILLRPILNFPRFELEFFPLLLIVIGLYFLIPVSRRVKGA